MTYDQISENLRRFNEWRRGGDGEPPDPTELSETIDAACDALLTLQRKRDEAREKIKRQGERIRELEGATNHAGGTPLSLAIKERDDARALLVRIVNDGTDGKCTESVSMDFLRNVPLECASIKRERDETRAKLAAERALADRLGDGLTNQAVFVALEAISAWKEARSE